MSSSLNPPRLLLGACAAPAAAFFSAFWLLPVLQLLVLPSDKGWATYFAVLTNTRYLHSLLNTLGLSLAVTLLTLLLGALVGITLARARFPGRKLLLSLLTLPLSFPGVIIGFFIILLGGRQGLIADLSEWAGLGRSTFAYGFAGLFLAYLYFSLPRAIATYTAAAESMPASSAAWMAAAMASAISWRSEASALSMMTRSMCSSERLTGSRWMSRGLSSTEAPLTSIEKTTRGLRSARSRSRVGIAT